MLFEPKTIHQLNDNDKATELTFVCSVSAATRMHLVVCISVRVCVCVCVIILYLN